MAVVAHDGARHIRDCLQSLSASGTPLSDVIVVDNASTDGTATVVASTFPEVRLVRADRNLGYGQGANLAARLVTSEYLVVLNQDLTAGPGLVARLVAALDDDPVAGLATPKVLLRSDPELVNACGNQLHYTGIASCRGFRRPSSQFLHTEPVPLISGAAFVIRMDLFRQLGGMDPLFFMYLEDADLSLRAALAGARSICVPAAIAIHDFEPRFSSWKIALLERNRALVLLRLLRIRTLLLLMPALVLTETLVLGYAASSGRGTLLAKLATYRWLARASRPIRNSRQAIQHSRRVGDRALLAAFSGSLDVEELSGRVPRLVATVANPVFRAWFALVRRVVSW